MDLFHKLTIKTDMVVFVQFVWWIVSYSFGIFALYFLLWDILEGALFWHICLIQSHSLIEYFVLCLFHRFFYMEFLHYQGSTWVSIGSIVWRQTVWGHTNFSLNPRLYKEYIDLCIFLKPSSIYWSMKALLPIVSPRYMNQSTQGILSPFIMNWWCSVSPLLLNVTQIDFFGLKSIFHFFAKSSHNFIMYLFFKNCIKKFELIEIEEQEWEKSTNYSLLIDFFLFLYFIFFTLFFFLFLFFF
jgi:hypothetical protein